MSEFKGKTFGRLTVIRVLPSGNKPVYFLCSCSCGSKNKRIRKDNVVSGRTKSCGCLARTSNLIHGYRYKRIYSIWVTMKNRCNNRRCTGWEYYGARGVKVCKRWDKFEHFLKDMGEPAKGLSLDRIDNSKGYSKSNCRWATRTEQANNKRSNVILTFDGKSKNIAEWGRDLNMNYETISSRVKRGWSVDKTLNTPVRKRGPR